MPTHTYKKYHISTRFLIKIILFHFPPKENISYFLEKRSTIFPDITKNITFRRGFFGKTIFSEHLKKVSYFQVFFWERSSFLLCLKNNIVFSGKRNIIFPDNTRKIIFQCDFFGKTIFSKHFDKENMVFHAAEEGTPCSKQTLYLKYMWQEQHLSSQPLSASLTIQPLCHTKVRSSSMCKYGLDKNHFRGKPMAGTFNL